MCYKLRHIAMSETDKFPYFILSQLFSISKLVVIKAKSISNLLISELTVTRFVTDHDILYLHTVAYPLGCFS